MSTPERKYAIVDLETTGGFGQENKITEIAIVISDGENILEEYQSLVNPERSIPSFIIGLTGIDNNMVSTAPKFYEIAKHVYQMLEGCVFVAHNVGFDAGVLKAEYESLGGEFNPKKLCTVRMSRSTFEGYKSYSLGNICETLGIELKDRHRAMGDAKATALLFHKIVAKKPEIIEESLHARSKEATLPPNINREEFEKLPNLCGVYYFLDENKEVIYVGKAIDIKKRVSQHFTKKDNRSRTQNFRRAVAHINYEITGSELIALLFESAEIKRLLPKFNRAQRRVLYPYGLYSYIDGNGYERLSIAKTNPKLGKPITTYTGQSDGRNHLFRLCEDFVLCAKLCGLQKAPKECFDYQINKCKGACIKEESPENYNLKVDALKKYLKDDSQTFVVLDKGRTVKEQSVVLVEKGIYKGYGFIDREEQVDNFEDFENYIQPQNNNKDIGRILKMQLKKKAYKTIYPKI